MWGGGGVILAHKVADLHCYCVCDCMQSLFKINVVMNDHCCYVCVPLANKVTVTSGLLPLTFLNPMVKGSYLDPVIVYQVRCLS